jgi:hypothetical protein
MYNWQDVGWCVGAIRKCNGDKRKTVDGYVANFEVCHELDDG